MVNHQVGCDPRESHHPQNGVTPCDGGDTTKQTSNSTNPMAQEKYPRDSWFVIMSHVHKYLQAVTRIVMIFDSP